MTKEEEGDLMEQRQIKVGGKERETGKMETIAVKEENETYLPYLNLMSSKPIACIAILPIRHYAF